MAGISLILAAICINGTCPTNNDTAENFYMSLDVGPSLQEENRTISFQRMQLNGQHLTVATLEDPPLSFTEIVNGTRVGRGVSFDLLDFLAEKLNFTYDVDVPKNNIIGADGDMEDSLIEMVNRTQADMAVAFIPLLGEPRKFVHYSSVTLDEGEWIMVMRRPAESANGSGLLAPFDYWVWILILISLLIVGPIIYVLIIIRNKITGDDAQKPYSLSHCAWFVYGALMKQGSTLSPIADSTRLLFATWWIFITILTSFYTANLTAFLTLSQFTLPFNTIDDILKKDKNFVALRGGGVEYAIINEGEPLEKLRIKRNLATFTSNTNDSETLIDYVERKDFVFIRDHPAIDHILYLDYQYRKNISIDNEKIHCPFAVAKIPILKTKRAFIFPRNSTWRTAFDQELLNLVEAGIVKYLVNRNLPNAEICPQNLAGTERQLRNGDLMMTYYIMAAGFSTATVVFVTELIFRFINEKNTKQSLSMHKKLPKKIASRSPFITNVTPPPPYGSIFNTSKDILVNVNNIKRAPDRSNGNGIKKFINGRDYMVFRGFNGESKLVPVRAPSATLFQYTYTE